MSNALTPCKAARTTPLNPHAYAKLMSMGFEATCLVSYLLVPAHPHLQALQRAVLAAVVHSNANGRGELGGDTSLLRFNKA